MKKSGDKELLADAQVLVDNLNSGIDLRTIEDRFIMQGKDLALIKDIKQKAFELEKEKYYDRILIHLLDINLEDHLDDFPLASNEQFEQLQLRAQKYIVREANKEVDQYYKEGKTIHDICNLVVNPYYDRTDVENQIKRSHLKRNAGRNVKNNEITVFITMIIIFIGVAVLTIATSTSKGGGNWNQFAYVSVSILLVGFGLRVLKFLS